MKRLGDVLATARKGRGLNQRELALLVGVTQPTINAYESGDEAPAPAVTHRLAAALGVTGDLLAYGTLVCGALAGDAHLMRSNAEARTSRQVEARLNLVGVHVSLLCEEVSLVSEQYVPTFETGFTSPQGAARMVRTQWRMPTGPVLNVMRWMEAAGCLVFEESFAAGGINGLSQWVGHHPVVLLNADAPLDRKRFALAHELGHLVLHSSGPTVDVESDADAFAAEFLMPEDEIRSELRRLDLGKLRDLKREWGVSMHALLERARGMQLVTPDSAAYLYARMNARGWTVNEPDVRFAVAEAPVMPAAIGQALASRGLTEQQAAELAGCLTPADNPFRSRVGAPVTESTPPAGSTRRTCAR